MNNFTAHYARVANPRIDLSISEKIVFATLYTTRTDKRSNPPTYHESVWMDVAFVGEAFEPAKALSGGEIIDVVRGSQVNERNSSGELKFKQTVFEFRLSDLRHRN